MVYPHVGRSLIRKIQMSDVKPDGKLTVNTRPRRGRGNNCKAAAHQQPDMAMFILSSYGQDLDGLQGLVGSLAAFADASLTTIDSMADELNRSADTVVPGADAMLARAAASVVSFDPSASA